jgi:hypothetical protein
VVIERVTTRGRSLSARSAHDGRIAAVTVSPFFVREIDFLVKRNSVSFAFCAASDCWDAPASRQRRDANAHA